MSFYTLQHKRHIRYKQQHPLPLQHHPAKLELYFHRVRHLYYRKESANRPYFFKCSTINDQILDNRESTNTPWFNSDCLTFVKPAHMQLTSSHHRIRAMCMTINIE